MNYYEEIINSLKRKVVNNVYLIYGEETFFINLITKKFKEYLLENSIQDFNFDLLDENANPSKIVELSNTMPFMSERRLIIVKNKYIFNSGKKKIYSEEGMNSLFEYIKSPNTSTCLVFTISDKIDGRSKTFKIIKEYGKTVKCDKLKEWDVIKWIDNNCLSNGKQIEKQAANYLCSTIGNDLEMLYMELQKIFSYVGEKNKIEIEDVKEICSRTLLNNIFELVDAMAEGKSEKSIYYLRDMLLAGEPKVKILFMIIRQYRLILHAKLLNNSGHSINTMIKKTGWHPYVAKKVLKQSKYFSEQKLVYILNQLLQLDIDLKTSVVSSEQMLETSLIKLIN